MIPTLTTPRLILRPMGIGDWDAYHRLMASDRARFMGGPFTPAVAWGCSAAITPNGASWAAVP